MSEEKDKTTNGGAAGTVRPPEEKPSAPGARRVRFGIRLKFSLAIISIVVLIIVSITMFFIWNESNLLRTQVMQMVERETAHLANTAQQSIGVDELSLIEAINDLKKIRHIKYAFVLDKGDLVVQYFDRRASRDLERPLADRVQRRLAGRAASGEVLVLNTDDPTDSRGAIYDFSKTVMDKLDRKIGTVIIGLSDIIIRDEIRNLMTFIIPISLLVLGIAIIASVVMTTFMIRPVRALSRGAEIIGKGNLDYRIEINTRDELGQLASEFNQMTAQIKEAKDKEIESRIMEEQIEMAKEIQEGLNPTSFYEKGGIQLKGYTKAARGVGGDYFDYIDIDDNRVGALISDVSGKGVPASLIMVMIRTVFTSYITRSDVDCASVVSAINDSLAVDFAMDKFATLFFLIYDRASEELTFSNAGHGPLFCYRASMKSCTITKLEGMPIGIDEDFKYMQARVKLHTGDMVVLFTDGVTEMRSEKGEEYGVHRLNKLIVENEGLNAEEFVRLLIHDLEIFRGNEPPHDDTTVLVLKKIS
jgi:serine phosphatase RsbU (regulator of sigma subunit)